jgi:hypothetical protein
MPQIPVACTLTAAEAGDRTVEWRELVDRHVATVDRADGVVRLHLRPGDESLLAAADLAARELACCAFFTFAIEITPDGPWLRASVPDDAAPILDALFVAPAS